ncbi:MAG: ABC transporter permease [Pyrinomonadaceae bacterium]|nr:ABC transporter permease [Pyrinomonadaceae bacterium]
MGFGDFKESFKMALDTVRANKLRSALTILGVCVGVITVMIMVSIIQGLNRSFATQIESLGSNTLFVSKFQPSFGRPPNQEERQRKDLTIEDAEAIERESKSIAGVSPFIRKNGVTIRYNDKQSETPFLTGATPNYEFVQSQFLGYGRFITDIDLNERTNVAILGQDVVNALFFNGEEPVGQLVKIDGLSFRVVGVMSNLGTFFGQSRDNAIWIPLTSFEKYYRDEDAFRLAIIVRPKTRADVPTATEEIRDVLRRRRQNKFGAPDNFGISSQDSLLSFYNQLTGATYLVLTAVSAVALMIGGIGVMNIMLVSVTERTREIGIRKAVGATKSSILTQFLIEAVVLTGIGGIIGLIIGEIVSLLLNTFSPLPAYVPPWAIVVGIGVSAGIGIIFGLYPAWKAASLDPIEALRYE